MATGLSWDRTIGPRWLNPVAIWAVIGWLAANGLALLLADGALPFDRPALAGQPFAAQMAGPSLGLLEVFGLMGVVWWMTRRRAIPDMAARAPSKARAAAETTALLAYAILGQVGGWLLGPALGYRPFSFHIAGTLVGCSTLASPGEAWSWMSYNFLVYAVVPYLWFRRRYSTVELNLKSTAPRADLTLILVVATIESAVELWAFPGIFKLTPHQLVLAAPLAFLIFFLGTVLPTMVLIYAILLPRYLKLTGSMTATVILGGLTYALMHLVEGWSVFATPRETALSLLFVFLQYTGPGMFKSFITLRTGNAWVHAIAYHAIAPHVVVDTPMIAKVFAIR
ncbi:MAG TPA: hypothetical protein VE309_00605 [Caulobacteraceae bacterium]|nr:hypothetical protein [Caulobacteraceae bacterium]